MKFKPIASSLKGCVASAALCLALVVAPNSFASSFTSPPDTSSGDLHAPLPFSLTPESDDGGTHIASHTDIDHPASIFLDVYGQIPEFPFPDGQEEFDVEPTPEIESALLEILFQFFTHGDIGTYVTNYSYFEQVDNLGDGGLFNMTVELLADDQTSFTEISTNDSPFLFSVGIELFAELIIETTEDLFFVQLDVDPIDFAANPVQYSTTYEYEPYVEEPQGVPTPTASLAGVISFGILATLRRRRQASD
jgi:hypothetical protein